MILIAVTRPYPTIRASSPKGSDPSAQGNALGNQMATTLPGPERAQLATSDALSGLVAVGVP